MRKTLKAAKTLCELSDWSLSNLRLQKILYIANRVHLGRSGKQLVDSPFEAWDYGPVSPEVYKECKMYGSKPVKHGFLLVNSYKEGEEYERLSEAYSILKDISGGQLVNMTHANGGAWAQVYRPGVKGIKIPVELIEEEFNAVRQVRNS